MGGVWRDVEVEVLLLLEQGSFKVSIDNSNGQVHEVDRSGRIFADPFKSEPAVHISLKIRPHPLILTGAGLTSQAPMTSSINLL
jgi:hypothetical protein